jgi:hypothetical protein
MTGWILFLAVLAIVSYLTDMGTITFLQNLKVPALNASLLSVLILLCSAGLLSKMLWMRRKAEKEHLQKRILELEKELKTLKEK